MKNILELKNVRLVYQTLNDETEAVNGLSFKLEAGKTLGIVGESAQDAKTRKVIRNEKNSVLIP
ncbi:MAG: hypothetical protein J5697_00240, partial [Clostridia bacterium]|nr:hypothetical protein [Clostridia bacterium]